ncbi:RabGAP/TBC [Phellopilus nigrolimitatus]|nr:RabGAP/TBC [Phellopilus nigrolimitatus]
MTDRYRKDSFESANNSVEGSVRSHNFSVDDAFSDGGEDNFEFTADSFRNELAKDMVVHSWSERNENEFEDIQLESSIVDPDSSVSTIDINAPSLQERAANPASVSLPPSPTSRSSQPSENSVRSNETLASPRHASSSPTSAHRAFPSVVIDVSKPPAPQITVLSNSSGSSSGLSNTLSNTPSNSDISASESSARPGEASPPKTAIPASISLPAKSSVPRPPSHRITKSTGPSTFEKVLSKTRPTFLPPKARQEDMKHLADWETMMKQSRAAEDRKNKLRAERRLAREHAVEESTVLWEQHILPDWKNAVRDEKIRKIWWNGIPPKLRGIVWEKAVGNGLALSKDTYRMCLARALRALASGTFPTTTLNLIDVDIRSTLPTLQIFTPSSGPLYQDLKDMLCAWVVSRSDEGLGYVVGASKIAAMFLLNMQPSSAFVSMRNLLERHCMRCFYGGLSSKDDVEAYYRIFDTLLADCMPKIYFNFKQHQIPPAAYLPDWIMPILLDHLPLEACARIWDVLVLEGDSFLFRAALAILATLEPRLFFPDRNELLGLLRGENKAALEVAKRNGHHIGSCKYEIYNLDEDNVWEELESLESWWKESTWTRLIQRELPDL